MTKITEENRDDIIEEYVDQIVEGMDMNDLLRLVGEMLVEAKQNYTNEELETEILEYYPELLGVDEE